MSSSHWSREEVEVTVDDYLSMLAAELAGVSYNKTAHRIALLPHLNGRSEQAIEFKRANISSVLLSAGFPSINGYKPRSHSQGLLDSIVLEKLKRNPALLELAASDADRPIVVPEVGDILAVLESRQKSQKKATKVHDVALRPLQRLPTNYLERESLNRSLGLAGEKFILEFERARLSRAGKESLAAKIEHTSQVRGDGEGYDILSFELNGAERLIEVKTTKYSGETPFFVTRNEVNVSKTHANQYQLYRLFTFRESPRLYVLAGAIDATCNITAATYSAKLR